MDLAWHIAWYCILIVITCCNSFILFPSTVTKHDGSKRGQAAASVFFHTSCLSLSTLCRRERAHACSFLLESAKWFLSLLPFFVPEASPVRLIAEALKGPKRQYVDQYSTSCAHKNVWNLQTTPDLQARIGKPDLRQSIDSPTSCLYLRNV